MWYSNIILDKNKSFFFKCGTHYEVLDDITSDRGPRFISYFYLWLLKTLDPIINLSLGYHPHIDSQTKSINQLPYETHLITNEIMIQ